MKYIPLDALVAEIRKRLLPVVRDKHYDEWEEGQDSERIAILDIINTFKVKEVDLEKEIDLVEDKYHGFESLSRADVIDVAKHFFALGLKAQKGE